MEVGVNQSLQSSEFFCLTLVTVASPHTSEIGIIFCTWHSWQRLYSSVEFWKRSNSKHAITRRTIHQNCSGGGGRMTPVSVSQWRVVAELLMPDYEIRPLINVAASFVTESILIIKARFVRWFACRLTNKPAGRMTSSRAMHLLKHRVTAWQRQSEPRVFSAKWLEKTK